MNVVNVVTFGAGAVLVYAAVRNVNPATAVKNALQGQTTTAAAVAANGGVVQPAVSGSSHAGVSTPHLTSV